MSSEIDILIVFSDADNVPSGTEDVLWVSQFKKFLEFSLSQVVDDKLNILLKGEYDSLTSPKLDNVRFLIPILSKNFISSSTCMGYVEKFYNAVGNDANRIFKVSKSPLDLVEQPAFLRPLLEYDMYQLDTDSGDLKEYTDYFSPDAERQYWMHLIDLSYDIAGALHRYRNEDKMTFVRPIQDQKVIYVAETGHDLSVERSIIIRELQRYGYAVLPKRALPPNYHELEALVKSNMQECFMSIHLIGGVYGNMPEGSTRSVVEIQHRIAAERNEASRKNNSTFSRLIWISPSLGHLGERQNKFIETIRRDTEGQDEAELLETPLEDFKNVLREELLISSERKHAKETGGRAIYLLHDRPDTDQIEPFRNLIEKCGFHVLTPPFDGDLLHQRQKHLENLRALDGVLIYKGTANEQWLRMKALDVVKAPGYGRKKPIVAKAVMASQGDIMHRDVFLNQKFRILEGDQSYFMDSLKMFLMELSS